MNDVQKEINDLRKETKSLQICIHVLVAFTIIAMGIMSLLFVKMGTQYTELVIRHRDLLNSYKECLETLQTLYSTLLKIAKAV